MERLTASLEVSEGTAESQEGKVTFEWPGKGPAITERQPGRADGRQLERKWALWKRGGRDVTHCQQADDQQQAEDHVTGGLGVALLLEAQLLLSQQAGRRLALHGVTWIWGGGGGARARHHGMPSKYGFLKPSSHYCRQKWQTSM